MRGGSRETGGNMKRSTLICDFCSEPNPAWMFAHSEIDAPLMKATMAAGHMAACDVCSRLLMAGKLESLVTRVLMSYQCGLEDVPEVRRQFRKIYERVTTRREVAMSAKEYRRAYPDSDGFKIRGEN